MICFSIFSLGKVLLWARIGLMPSILQGDGAGCFDHSKIDKFCGISDDQGRHGAEPSYLYLHAVPTRRPLTRSDTPQCFGDAGTHSHTLCAVVADHLGAPTGRQSGCLRNRRWAFSTSAESTRGSGLPLLPLPLLSAPVANWRCVPSLEPSKLHPRDASYSAQKHYDHPSSRSSYTAFCFYICRFECELFGSSFHDLSRKIKLFARTLKLKSESIQGRRHTPGYEPFRVGLENLSNCTRRKPKSFEYVDMLLFDLRPDLQHN